MRPYQTAQILRQETDQPIKAGYGYEDSATSALTTRVTPRNRVGTAELNIPRWQLRSRRSRPNVTNHVCQPLSSSIFADSYVAGNT